MSNVVGTLVIQMAADVAKLTNDMNLVKGQIGSAMSSVENAVGKASKALGTLGIGIGLASFGTMIKGAIDSAAAFHDLSIRTGASVESLAGFAKIGRETGTTGDDIAKMMAKLSKGLAVTTEETKGVNAALGALGINVEDFRKLKPDEQMLAIAKAMNQFADGSGKAAVAQVLFGRAGAEALPFLRDLANATEIHSKLTAEDAKAADDFNDKVTNLQGSIKGFIRTVVVDLLPILTKIVDGLGMAAKVALAYYTAMVAIPAVVSAATTAMRAYGASLAAAEIAAEMGIATNAAYAGSFELIIKQVGALKLAMGVLFAAFAGWQIGTWLRENFLEAQLAGIAFVEGTLVGWERIKYGAQVAWLAVKSAAGMAVDAIVTQFADMIEAVGRGLQALGAEDFGGRLIQYALNARAGATSTTEFAAEMSKLRTQMDSNIEGVRAITGDMAEYAIQQFGVKEATAAGTKELDYNADAAAEAAKAAEAAGKKYGDLMDELAKVTTEAKAATGSSKDLTDAEKLELSVLAKLNDGKVKLTKAQQDAVKAALADAKAALTARDAHKAALEVHNAAVAAMDTATAALQKEIDKQKEANSTYGMTADELAKLEVARLEEAAATYKQQAALLATIPGLEQEAKWYEEQAKGLTELARLKNEGIHVKAAEDARKAWQETTDSVFNGLTDALYRAFESGKGFMQAFRDTLENAFQTLVLRPTIEAMMRPIAGAMGGVAGSVLGSPAQAGVPGSGSGVLGGLGNIGTAIGVGGSMLGAGLGYGLAAYGASATIGGTLAGAGAMISGGLAGGMAGLGSVMAGVGAIIGVLGPIALGVYALVKLGSRGPKEVRERGIEGTVVEGDINARQFARWYQSGGAFHSSRRGFDYSAPPEEMQKALQDATGGIYQSVQQWANVVGLPADLLEDVTYKLKFSYGKTEEETQKNIEAALTAYQDALANRFARVLQPFQRAGETLSETLQRLTLIQSFSNAINEFGGVFSRIAHLSIDAREELIGLAGGIENFIQKAQSFVGTYYTEDEQRGIGAKQLSDALRGLGINPDSLSSKADFRALVESVDVTTTAGREQLNALLSIAPAFAQIADALGNGQTLSSLAANAPVVTALETMFNTEQVTLDLQRTSTQTLQDVKQTIWDLLTRTQENHTALANLLTAGLGAIATHTAATTRLLERWDNNGQLSTTTEAP